MDDSLSLFRILYLLHIFVYLIDRNFHFMFNCFWFLSIRLSQIRSLIFYILPLCVTQYISHTFLFYIVPPIIPSYHTNQCISNCVTHQPLPVKDQWNCVYQTDPDAKVFMDRLYFNIPLDEQTILKLQVGNRTIIPYNLLLEGRCVYYGPILDITKYICRMLFQYYAIHVAGNMGNTKPFIGLDFDF